MAAFNLASNSVASAAPFSILMSATVVRFRTFDPVCRESVRALSRTFTRSASSFASERVGCWESASQVAHARTSCTERFTLPGFPFAKAKSRASRPTVSIWRSLFCRTKAVLCAWTASSIMSARSSGSLPPLAVALAKPSAIFNSGRTLLSLIYRAARSLTAATRLVTRSSLGSGSKIRT